MINGKCLIKKIYHLFNFIILRILIFKLKYLIIIMIIYILYIWLLNFKKFLFNITKCYYLLNKNINLKDSTN